LVEVNRWNDVVKLMSKSILFKTLS
jgi:hypothetical protein